MGVTRTGNTFFPAVPLLSGLKAFMHYFLMPFTEQFYPNCFSMVFGPAITGTIFKEIASALINFHENLVCGKFWFGISKNDTGPEYPCVFEREEKLRT